MFHDVKKQSNGNTLAYQGPKSYFSTTAKVLSLSLSLALSLSLSLSFLDQQLKTFFQRILMSPAVASLSFLSLLMSKVDKKIRRKVFFCDENISANDATLSTIFPHRYLSIIKQQNFRKPLSLCDLRFTVIIINTKACNVCKYKWNHGFVYILEM